MPNGNILVAEGHGGQNANAAPDTVARISIFTKDGKFIRSFGKLGSAPGEFRTPHSLAFDSRNRLFVADRGNVRLQIFDQEGKFLEETKLFSRLSGIYIDKNDMLYGADSESSDTSNKGWRKDDSSWADVGAFTQQPTNEAFRLRFLCTTTKIIEKRLSHSRVLNADEWVKVVVEILLVELVALVALHM